MNPRSFLRSTRIDLSLIALAAVFVSATALLADPIPYSNVGTVAPTVVITVTATGSIEGYFYGMSAADTDKVAMEDLTTHTTSAYTFDNQTTSVGTAYDFGSVNAGDQIVFLLDNISTGKILSSDPALSADGLNHAYITPYTATDAADGPAGIPAGTFVGMEDLTVPGSDLDYNDDQFVFTDLSATSVMPEPSSLILLGTGVLAAAGMVRRRMVA